MTGYIVYDEGRPLPYDWTHPQGVPRTYDELYTEYGRFIASTLRRHNRVDRNMEDLLSGVWEYLLKANLLKKFAEGAARRLPLHMKGHEAQKFLGVTPGQWNKFIMTNEHALHISPKEGSRTDFLSVWETASLCDLDEAGLPVVKRRIIKRWRPPVSGRGFKTYLQKSVHNAFANLCRWRSRRHQEFVLAPDTVVQLQSNGSYKARFSKSDSPPDNWEANITAAMADEETLLDLISTFRAPGMSDEVLDFMVKQGSEKDGPKRNIELLGLLKQGYTLKEAAQMVQPRVRTKARVHVMT